jgi:hypothetical protein
MDITPVFRTLLAAHGGPPPPPPPPHDPSRLNSFLQEAYRIHGHVAGLARYLRAVRAPYLALPSSHHHHHRHPRPATQHAPPGKKSASAANGAAPAPPEPAAALTDADRAAIEASTTSLLQTLSRAVDDLAAAARAAADLHAALAARERDARGLGVLGRWAAGAGVGGGVAKTEEERRREDEERDLALHRGGVVLGLKAELGRVAGVQAGMVEVRLRRARERGRSALHMQQQRRQQRVGGDAGWRAGGETEARMEAARAVRAEDEEKKEEGVESLLSPDQIRVFEREQEDMVKFYNSELLKIRFVPFPLPPLHRLTALARSSPPWRRSPRSRRS